MRKFIVCGDRGWIDADRVDAALDKVLAYELCLSPEQLLLILGGAKGVDELARQWACKNEVAHIVVPARWRAFGKEAGPLRNARMLRLCPEAVIAFPGGAGTAHMRRIAREAGVHVVQVPSHA